MGTVASSDIDAMIQLGSPAEFERLMRDTDEIAGVARFEERKRGESYCEG
jgi:hypothetical protein